MRLFKNKKSFTGLFFIALQASILFAQETLSNLNTSWANVISGNVICEPALTSYGFVLATDAKNVCAFSETGTLLWEKYISRSKDVKLYNLPGDFILFEDRSNNTIKMLNPSGCEIWSKVLNYKMQDYLLPGRDGRFFIAGDHIIECYSTNGICKWSLETPAQKNNLMQELPDGSIVLFLSEENGKTKGLRISPFGTVLEEILFAGQIIKTCSCSNGVLLTFSDGTDGLFSTVEGESKNKWVIKEKYKESFFVSDTNGEFLLISNSNSKALIHKINKNSGEIISSFLASSINYSDIRNCTYSKGNIFLVDSKNGILLSDNWNSIWEGKIPASFSKWNYLFYTQNDYLVFCKNDWSISAYRTLQKQGNYQTVSKNYGEYLKNLDIAYDILYSQAFSQELVANTRLSTLSTGYYGDTELIWEKEILSICQSYAKECSSTDFGTRKEKSIFDLDTTGFESILNQLILFCNDDTQNCAAQILSRTTNKSYIKVLLSGVSKNGYDPDGNLLKAVEALTTKIDYKDKTNIKLICDSVYSICEFMGRPAFNAKGKNILKNFLYPNYDSKTRDYARETLKKIIALDL